MKLQIILIISLQLPVAAVVGNDACWSQIKREQVPLFGSDVACELSYCSYDAIASGYGGLGISVGADDQRHLIKRFNWAKEQQHAGNSVLINCVIGKSDFRDGSISV